MTPTQKLCKKFTAKLRIFSALFAFFITCAFAAPPTDPLKATTLQYVTRISMWVVQLTLVIDAVFLMFFMFCVFRKEIEWMKMGTNIWTARQLIILQVFKSGMKPPSTFPRINYGSVKL